MMAANLSWVCAGLLFASPCHAQEAAEKKSEAPPPPITAIVGGDVWTVTKGVIKRGVVIVKGTKIEQVGGPETAVPAGATVVDAKGRIVTPGFITPMAAGLVRAGGAGGAGNRLRDSLDPYSLPVSLALATGVTAAYVSGGAGGFGGGEDAGGALSTNNAIVKMTEGDINGMLLKEPSVATFGAAGGGGGFGGGRRFGGGGGGSVLTSRYNLRDQLQRAYDYQAKVAQAGADRKAGKQATDPRRPVGIDEAITLVKKERILRMTANDVAEIRWALKLVDDFGIKMVLTPATEAWIVADEIAKRDVAVMIVARARNAADDRKNFPSGANPDAAGILQKAGVKVAVLSPTPSFSTGGEMGRDLLTYPLEAMFAMRGGMDAQSALEALTILPARLLGVADRIGSIEAGKDADLLVMSGDPLDYRSFPERTYVNGKLLYEKERSSFFGYVKSRLVDAGADH